MNSHEMYVKRFRQQSLGELEKQHLAMQAGPHKMEIECGLLRAQIEGLLQQRPEGFGGRVEQFRAQLEKYESALVLYQEQRLALEQVIEEKRAEFR